MNRVRLILLLSIIVFAFSSCASNNTNEINKEPLDINFSTKSANCLKEDWLYFCYVDYDKNTKLENATNKNYNFNAYNLKYKKLNEYSKIPIIDSESNTLVGYAESSIPVISYGTKYSHDIEVLYNWLNSTKPTSEIKIEDLYGLNLENIDVKLFASLFNQMINSDQLKTGKYASLPEADIVQEEFFSKGYKWQIGYFISHGVLMSVNIELLYDRSKDIYLSDIVSSGNCNLEERQIQNLIDELEFKIIDCQTFYQIIPDYSVGNVDFGRLKTLVLTLEEG